MPKVSVVVPVYKAEKFIERAIVSLLNQTLSDIEIIIVIDGSPDNSKGIIRKYENVYSNIKVVDLQENVGTMVARTKGWQIACGDYITFMDSDDTMPQNALEILYERISVLGADVVSGSFCYMDNNGNRLVNRYLNFLNYGHGRMGAFKALLNREITPTLWGKIFSRELLQSFNYDSFENCTNGEDAATLFQICNNIKQIEVVDEVVYCYHENMDSSCHNNYTAKAIESVCRTTIIREKVLMPFKELEKDVHTYFTQNLTPCRRTKEGRKLLKQYGLYHYTTPISIIRNIQFPKCVKLLFKLILRK